MGGEGKGKERKGKGREGRGGDKWKEGPVKTVKPRARKLARPPLYIINFFCAASAFYTKYPRISIYST